MMRTSEHKTVWPRLAGAMALAAYLVLLSHAHTHVALELHALGNEVAHTEPHAHGSDHEHLPHPVTDHELADSPACLAQAEQLVVHDFINAANLVPAPGEEAPVIGAWIEDKPKHPPPRLPEQPRSPPTA